MYCKRHIGCFVERRPSNNLLHVGSISYNSLDICRIGYFYLTWTVRVNAMLFRPLTLYILWHIDQLYIFRLVHEEHADLQAVPNKA